MKSIGIVFFGLTFITLTAFASDSNTGRVAVWHDGVPLPYEVELNIESAQGLSNKRVSVINPPANLLPDDTGCFCFDINDGRFALVHAFYYANNQILEVNKILK